MSQQPISRSTDLTQLRNDGYDIEIVADHLVLRDVPYVNASGEVKRGTLVSTLRLSGDVTAAPDTHVAMFIGEFPCDENGSPLEAIRSGDAQQLADNLAVDFSFSSKPIGQPGYPDYHAKLTAYVAILESRAHAIDRGATARTFRVVATEEGDSVFNYMDTATSRAGIGVVNDKLALDSVAIIGLGGSGSYVLDQVAKTLVKEIHLFDGDIFYSHNAFRAPGAASLEELRAQPHKVTYLHALYSPMHRGIVPHDYNIDATNVDELRGMAFVFLCVDAGEDKQAIVEKLEEYGITFIDVGMGIELVDDSLRGIVRATMSTPNNRQAFRRRAPLAAVHVDEAYDRNIQIADLNALNAVLAVIRWKKLLGVYHDYARTLQSTYTIDCDMLLSEEPDAGATN